MIVDLSSDDLRDVGFVFGLNQRLIRKEFTKDDVFIDSGGFRWSRTGIPRFLESRLVSESLETWSASPGAFKVTADTH